MRNYKPVFLSAICFILTAFGSAKGQIVTTVFERSDAQSSGMTKKLEAEVGWKFGYRIPSLLVTEKGTVLAFADRRKVGIGTRKDGAKLPDGGIPTDVLLKRSLDGGKTWQTEQILFPAEDCNYHGEMAVADNKSGRIYKFARRSPLNEDAKADGTEATSLGSLTCKQTREKGYGDYFVYSDDDGQNWSSPQPVDLPYPDDALNCSLCNGVHGIQFEGGRMLILGKYTLASSTGKSEAYTQVFCSDDGGKTWKKGSAIKPSGSNLEVVMAKVDEHTVLINHRPSGGKKHAGSARNAYRIGKDGEELINSYEHCFYAAICHAGLTSQPGRKTPYPLFLTAPSASLTANSKELPRQNLTLLASRDGGDSWTREMVVDSGISSYSDLQFTRDGALLCLYEAGDQSKYIKCWRLEATDDGALRLSHRDD